VWPFAALATAVSCGGGGGGGGGEVAGLTTPEQVSIVEADASGSAPLRLPSGIAAAGLSDYEKDRMRLWVHDDSMSALETINEILCALDQTNYDDPAVLNQGPYLALVNCFDEEGGDSRDDVPRYEEWVVDSARASNSSPHVVKFWLHVNVPNGGGADVRGRIYGKATIRSSPTEANPVGDFTLDFKALTLDQRHDDPDTRFEGYLTTVARTDGQSEYAFFLAHGDVDNPTPGEFAMRERCRVVGDPQAQTGRAFTEQKSFGGLGDGELNGEEFHVQFDADYLVRKRIAGGTAVKAFDRNAFTTYVHRYGLYDADGARVNRLSGFPVDTADGKHGWVGFHGMWFPPEVTITDGQTLLRRSFQGGQAPVAYTAVVVPGRLEKLTRRAIALGDLIDEDLETFDQIARQSIRVRWTGSDLVKTARWQSNAWQPVEPPVSIAGMFTPGQFVHLYSQHRGGVELVWPSGAPQNTTPASTRTSTVITQSSPELEAGDLTLLGYVRRLKAAITQNEANYLAGQSPHFLDALNVGDVKTYAFAKATMMLQLDGVDVALAPGVTVAQGPGVHGFECGPLVTSALGSLEELQQQGTTYLWRTGPNEWNQLRTVRDAGGAIVAFDPPLVFDYTHAESGSPFDGRRFALEWDGSHLGGIPHVEGAGGRFDPQFNIPSGTTLTLDGATYRLKQLEGEQRMNEIADVAGVMAARGFDLTTNLLTPPTGGYVDPAIGPMPELDAAPRFVGGVAQ